MTNAWIKGLKRRLNAKAPLIEVDGLRQSRRVAGQYSHTAEIKAYEDIFFYIQKGFGIYQSIISDIVSEVLNFQGSTGRTHYSVYPFSFGWNDDTLHHKKSPISVISRGNKSKVISALCEIAGTDLSNSSSEIPYIYPTGGFMARKRKVSSNDLLVFICIDKTIKISKSIEVIYNRFRKRSLWIFLNNDAPEWELSNFKPEVNSEMS